MLLISALPLLTWILLGIIVKSEIANVFSLTYPLQFIYVLLILVFAVGANITARKIRDKNVVGTNLVVGTVVIGGVTALICLMIDGYLEWMGVEAETYHDFSIYCIIRCFLTSVIQMISQKLYYDNEIKRTNTMNIIYGLVDFMMIVGLSAVVDNVFAIVVTLLTDATIVMIFFGMYYEKGKFSLRLWDNVKNTSFEILDNLGMLFSYGLGLANSFSYGKEFLNAINFETLVTDAQWDMLNESVGTVAKVDITERKLNYKKLRNEAWGLVGIFAGTTLIMTIVLYWYYRPELWILVVLLVVQFVDMIVCVMNDLRLGYMQIRDNRIMHNGMILLTRGVRIACALIPTGFCVYIGQLVSTFLKYVYARWVCRKFKVFRKERQ